MKTLKFLIALEESVVLRIAKVKAKLLKQLSAKMTKQEEHHKKTMDNLKQQHKEVSEL